MTNINYPPEAKNNHAISTSFSSWGQHLYLKVDTSLDVGTNYNIGDTIWMQSPEVLKEQYPGEKGPFYRWEYIGYWDVESLVFVLDNVKCKKKIKLYHHTLKNLYEDTSVPLAQWTNT